MTASSTSLALEAFGLQVRVTGPAEIVRDLGAVVPLVPEWVAVAAVARSVAFRVLVDRFT